MKKLLSSNVISDLKKTSAIMTLQSAIHNPSPKLNASTPFQHVSPTKISFRPWLPAPLFHKSRT